MIKIIFSGDEYSEKASVKEIRLLGPMPDAK